MKFHEKMRKFNEIYQELYAQCEEDMENLRNSAKKESIMQLVGMIVVTVGLIYGFVLFLMSTNNENFVSIFGFIIPIIIIFGLKFIKGIFSSKQEEYKRTFKNKVIKTLVKTYSDNLNYKPNMGITQRMYLDGEFERYDRYRSEDDISGTLEQGYRIEMSEVHTEMEHRDKDGHVTYSTLFHGLFACIEMDAYVKDNIKIRKNSVKFFDKKERIEMDSGEFEKIYDLYSVNKIYAMQLFTADILQLFMDFRKISPEITIKGNKLYIRFETGDIFEANLFKESFDYNTLKKYFSVIGFVIELTDIIHKNIKELEE